MNTDDKTDEDHSITAQIAAVRLTLFDLYLAKIRQAYLGVPEPEKKNITVSLETIISHLDRKKDIIIFSLKDFDGEYARSIRREAGLTTAELAKEIGWPTAQSRISAYEHGRERPIGGQVARAYFEWLGKHGYTAEKIETVMEMEDNLKLPSIDLMQAKQIRHKENLSLKNLANLLGAKLKLNTHTQTYVCKLSCYERGVQVPKGEFGDGYLKWLGEHGYSTSMQILKP